MEESSVNVECVWIDSAKGFGEVLVEFGRHISRPNMTELVARWTAAKEYGEVEEIVRHNAGPADLKEFMRFPLGAFTVRDPAVIEPFSMVRLVVGNPIIMESMARYVPEVGSYAPVTILVFERNGKVRIHYDRLASLIAPYGSRAASEIARGLDDKIIGVISEVA